MRVAIIPARGGSKRIPRKNIRPFDGKPIIAYSIEAALVCGLFDEVIVSTDDDEIAQVARQLGASTPFVRPPELAVDHTPTVPVISHAINACSAAGWHIDDACCIYPCAPLIQIDDLRAALALLQDSGADYAFPVAEYPSPIQRALKRNAAGILAPAYPEFQNTCTQELDLAFYDAGQFYWGAAVAWLSNPRIHSSGAGLLIPAWRAVDIDTPEDWKRAEAIHYSLSSRHSDEHLCN